MDVEQFSDCLDNLDTILDEMTELMGENHDFFTLDNIRNKLDTIFKNAIGDKYPEDRIEAIYNEGKERYESKIPPGFKDDKYGDLVIWYEIMDYSKLHEVPIIFVTKDFKTDWWFRSKSNYTIGPHPDLLKEFSSYTDQEIYIYTYMEFLKDAKPFLNVDISSDTLDNIAEIEKLDDIAKEIEDFQETGIINENTLSAIESIAKMQESIGNSPLTSYNNQVKAMVDSIAKAQGFVETVL